MVATTMYITDYMIYQPNECFYIWLTTQTQTTQQYLIVLNVNVESNANILSITS